MPNGPGVRTARKLLVGIGIGLAFISICGVAALIYLSRLNAIVRHQALDPVPGTGIACVLRATVDQGEVDPLVSTAVFRIFQESLTNVARHSHASRVAVTLEHRRTDLVLEVRDDGIGIVEADASHVRSIGLAGMRERAQLVGGGFSISGAPSGTTVLVQIQWHQEAKA